VATLTIKNIPEPFMRRLKKRAAAHRRSLNLSVPLLWRSEFRNGSIRLVRKAALQLDEALTMIEEAEVRTESHQRCSIIP
jgi:plasmid stability protein